MGIAIEIPCKAVGTNEMCFKTEIWYLIFEDYVPQNFVRIFVIVLFYVLVLCMK
jgi:hypothetical protein